MKLELTQAADECIIELKSIGVSKQKDFPALVVRGEWNILGKIRDAVSEA